ncbi:MAG: NAD(P)/FAD-dependent oxidoreductase [Chloroflexi bacterium]|nr:NAD(P)/FAD-dependent oxidoreductase [Chloroflexota bacterium]
MADRKDELHTTGEHTSAAEPKAGTHTEVAIIGGGVAGLSAALVLGRSRKRTLVIDAGEPRNAPSPGVHSFFSRDGMLPADLLRIGREQLAPYDSVQLRRGRVSTAERVGDRFHLHLDDGGVVTTRRVVLTLGVVDELPDIEGLRERWGHGVFHCPYCHGWEMRDQPLAVLGNGAEGVRLARLATGWTRDIMLCTNGPATFGHEERALLARCGIAVHERRVARVDGEGKGVSGVVFEGGEMLPRAGVLVRPPIHQRSDLPAALGCALTEQGVIRTDEDGRTSVPGVFAVGDCASLMQQVAVAVGQATRAAIVLNNELVLEATARCASATATRN